MAEKNEELEKELKKKKKSFDKQQFKSQIFNFFIVKYLLKLFSIFYAKMTKVSTKDIYILDAVEDEEFLKNRSLYRVFDEYYDADNFIYTLAPKKTIGYSLSHIAKEFTRVIDKKALLIIAEETNEDFEFYFAYTGEPYNKDSLGYLSIPKNEYLADDKRLHYALIYYLFIIEHKEIYIMSEKKLEFFTGFEKYVRYLRKHEVYQIMIRTQMLDKSSSKLLKFFGLIALNSGIIYGMDYLSTEYFKKMETNFKTENNKYKALIEEQTEKTNKSLVAKEDLVNFLNDGKGVLKDKEDCLDETNMGNYVEIPNCKFN